MRFFAFLFFLLALLAGCSGAQDRAVSPEATKLPVVTLHLDVAFTPDERAAIQEAADSWSRQTSGLATMFLYYDVDFDSVQNLGSHVLVMDNIFVRAESWMDSVKASDEDSECNGCVLGWTTSGGIHNLARGPVIGALVVDRIPTHGLLVQVVMHEFGHVFGLPHSPARQAIMYPSASAARTNCLKQPDLSLFCQVNQCGNYRMLPCE